MWLAGASAVGLVVLCGRLDAALRASSQWAFLGTRWRPREAGLSLRQTAVDTET
jgi:hypothetical protein